MSRQNRREFLRNTALSGAVLSTGFWSSRAIAAATSPNEKLNIAIIGAGGQGGANLSGVSGETIVAICDVDEERAAAAYKSFPQARRFRDFRRLFDELKEIDAVVVSTPDHTHAPASIRAMRLGKHVYCEKPLAHSVFEVRLMIETAAKHKVATQMGTQIHAGDNYRRVVELVQAGAVGPVGEVHVWQGSNWSGGERPKDTPPVPATLDWDLWLGPAPERPYHSAYVPFNWRRWWDFGSGTLGDMGCHYMDLPFWALKLRHPLTVEAEGPEIHPETTPPGLIVRYEYPARDDQPAVKLTWYDAGKKPPFLAERNIPDWGSAVLFIGAKGMLLADYNQHRLLPEATFKDYQRPAPKILASVGHHQEWIRACKTGEPTTCNFDYSGALAESVLLGNVAFRTGKKLDWDSAKLEARNCPEAAQFIRREYRSGWEL